MFQPSIVVFDLDGTLIDTAPDLWRATNHVLRTVGRAEIELNAVRHMVGHGGRALIREGLKATGGIDGHDIEMLLPEFLNYYSDNIALASKPYDGTVELLGDLKSKGIKTAICTNKPESLAHKLMTELSIGHEFDALTGGDSLPFKKPDPRHIFETAKLAGSTDSILMIGDSINDTQAAINLGIPSVAVSFGYTDIPVHELGADKVIDHYNELIDLIQPM